MKNSCFLAITVTRRQFIQRSDEMIQFKFWQNVFKHCLSPSLAILDYPLVVMRGPLLRIFRTFSAIIGTGKVCFCFLLGQRGLDP